jgi:hypothetical protein
VTRGAFAILCAVIVVVSLAALWFALVCAVATARC